jgi:hypothetical protein
MVVYHTSTSTLDFHKLMEDLASYLEMYHGASWVKEYTTPFLWYHPHYGKETPLSILDCELLIHYPETDSYKGVSFCDSHSRMISFLMERNSKDDLILCSQYSNTGLVSYHTSLNLKIVPSIYTPQLTREKVDLDVYYKQRKQKTNFIDKFIFRGNVYDIGRGSINFLTSSEWFNGYTPLGTDAYFSEIINYKVGLSIPGVGELCYRDIEYMALGVPMMKFEYGTQLNPPLIPNYHYISIDRFDMKEGVVYDGRIVEVERYGGENYAVEYINKFLEVKDDNEFLNYISTNARNYYEMYLHPDTRLNHVLTLLEFK